DEFFRRICEETAKSYPELKYENFIVDDFARRVVQSPHDLDVVVMPNLYGDDYAYFESVHGTAPDIMGQHIINPTATMLSAAMMLEYLGFAPAAKRFEEAVRKVYADGRTLTPDQGGTAKTDEFARAVVAHL